VSEALRVILIAKESQEVARQISVSPDGASGKPTSPFEMLAIGVNQPFCFCGCRRQLTTFFEVAQQRSTEGKCNLRCPSIFSWKARSQLFRGTAGQRLNVSSLQTLIEEWCGLNPTGDGVRGIAVRFQP